MNRRTLIAAQLVLSSVLSLTQARAEPDTSIRVDLELGESFRQPLSAQDQADAKQLAEQQVAEALQQEIGYFSFVPSTQTSAHTLTFSIDHPSSAQAGTPGIASLYDYYVFLQFKKNNGAGGDRRFWLFRDAAASLNGADTPQTIAARLTSNVKDPQYRDLITNMLSGVSFTNKAHFEHQRFKGWIIDHPRESLCLAPDSQLKIESTVPEQPFDKSFVATVMHSPQFDGVSTLTTPENQTQVDVLMTNPDAATVVAVYVIRPELECKSTFAESMPSAVNLGNGGQP